MRKTTQIALLLIFISGSLHGQVTRFLDQRLGLSRETRVEDMLFKDDKLIILTEDAGVISINEEYDFIYKVNTNVYGTGLGHFNKAFENHDDGFWLKSNFGYVLDSTSKQSLSKWDDDWKVNHISGINNTTFIGINEGLLVTEFNESYQEFRKKHISRYDRRKRKGSYAKKEELGSVYAFIKRSIVEQNGSKNDVVYVGGDNGLFVYKDGVVLDQGHEQPIKFMIAYKEGFLFGNERKINYMSDFGAEIIEDYVDLTGEDININDIRDIGIDKYENLWIVSDKVVVRSLANSKELRIYHKNSLSPFGSEEGKCITFSNSFAYVGTYGSGIYRFEIPFQPEKEAISEELQGSSQMENDSNVELKADEILIKSRFNGRVRNSFPLDSNFVIGDLSFIHNDSTLLSWSKKKLNILALNLLTIEEAGFKMEIELTGHTAKFGKNPTITAKKLSLARANMVKKIFRLKGVESDILTEGVGEDELLKGEDPESSKNQRVTIKIVSIQKEE